MDVKNTRCKKDTVTHSVRIASDKSAVNLLESYIKANDDDDGDDDDDDDDDRADERS